jgi:hypothetical protein
MKNHAGTFEELPLEEQLFDEMFSTKQTDKCRPDVKIMARNLSMVMAVMIDQGLLAFDESNNLVTCQSQSYSYASHKAAAITPTPSKPEVTQPSSVLPPEIIATIACSTSDPVSVCKTYWGLAESGEIPRNYADQVIAAAFPKTAAYRQALNTLLVADEVADFVQAVSGKTWHAC